MTSGDVRSNSLSSLSSSDDIVLNPFDINNRLLQHKKNTTTIIIIIRRIDWIKKRREDRTYGGDNGLAAVEERRERGS
jgi:hypothetical protein